jgi:prevent-host-death family protein
MRQTVTTLEMRERLGEILDRVRLRQEELVIERKGRPVAALVPLERLDQMQRAARQAVLALMDRQPGSDLTDDEAMQLADEAKHATRPKVKKAR